MPESTPETPPEPADVAAEMRKIKVLADAMSEEPAHIAADELLCSTLRRLGYGEAVDVFEQMPKWYA